LVKIMKILANMNLLIFLGCVALLGVMSAPAAEPNPWEGFEGCLWVCISPDHPGGGTTPRDFARARDKTDAELAEKLVEIIQRGMREDANAEAASHAQGALWHLRGIGGEKEFAVVREVMRTTKDVKGIRRTAILVGIEMMPEKWEEWLREVMADERSDNYDCFLVCQEAFRIGRDGDDKTRRRVVEVLEEMKRRNLSDADRRDFDKWIDELEKMP